MKALPCRLLACLLSFAVAMVGLLPVAASAAGPAAESTEAPSEDDRLEQLYASARTLYDEGQYDAAATAFIAAYEVSPEPNLLFNIYVCYDRVGKLEQALEYLDKYIASSPPDDPADLQRRKRSLEARLGRQQAAETKTDDGGTQGPVQTGPTDDGPRDDGSVDKKKVFGPAAIALTAVTAVALGIGIGFGASALNQRGKADDECGDDPAGGLVCNDAAEDHLDRRKTHALVADVSFGVAGAAGIALITVIAVRAAQNKRARQNAARARLSPSFARGSAGLTLSGRF